MASKVFISHKNSDSAVATRIAQRVKANGLDVYLDVIDYALDKDGPDLADYLLKRMADCDQLIAVISRETQTSWWVPWEIGVGAEKSFRMASYATATASVVPEYLRKWPVLKSENDVDLYCRISKSKRERVFLAERAGIRKSIDIRRSYAAEFHRELKTALGR